MMPTIDQMIRARAKGLGGIPYWVVEKDYAISYLLAGITRIDRLSEGLILKGGTALSKFYFESYRFSEDLDFTLRQAFRGMEIGEAMDQALRAMEMLLQERGPFRVQSERLMLREPHPGGQEAFVVRVQFPAHREALCRLKVEITADEQVLLPPERRSLRHRFPEAVDAMLWCYPLEEIVAEKLRALLQSRTRLRERGWGASRVCRDYYDLWRILGDGALRKDLLPSLVTQECAHRDVAFESPLDFFAPALLETARAEWEHQLRPFVPDCPAVEYVVKDLQPWVVSLWRDV
jgi:predicted nucleotidyltransferase component of viral defense system